MAGIGLPKFLKRCGCGMLLVKDYPGDSEYWTAFEPYLKEIGDDVLPEDKCPECGGDENIPIGLFFHRRFYEKFQKIAISP